MQPADAAVQPLIGALAAESSHDGHFRRNFACLLITNHKKQQHLQQQQQQ